MAHADTGICRMGLRYVVMKQRIDKSPGAALCELDRRGWLRLWILLAVTSRVVPMLASAPPPVENSEMFG
ncbi:hypothetical protein RCCGE510_20879 [Rhizobium sp. CCGE 510]|nr:hypothetical protein RCCGE510_20879 [Rhizobium sp. CCGE 510]